jgi:peptidoglycan hydrolase-like protein with peptidoglycan-binding domain
LPGFVAQVFMSAAGAEPPPPQIDASIATMQLRLQALGLYAGAADGRPSEALREALRRFQVWAGLRGSGDVHDPATRILLRDAARGAVQAGRAPRR